MLSWVLCAVLLAVTVLLGVKLYLLKKNITEICAQFNERLSIDTNTPVTVSSGDKSIRYLASEINRELRILRRQRRQYLEGDKRQKEAVTNISHDLRTPLTAISGYLELLEREESSDAVRRYLAFIKNRTELMKQLTEELFSYTFILASEELNFEPVDIRAVLEESVLAFFGAFVKSGIEPRIQLPDAKVIKNLDKSAVSRVFSNILSNVLKYSDGDLYVKLTRDGEIEFANMASSLDEVSVGKLFDRFFTVETAHNSTGLGLSISKTLVEQLGGSVTAVYDDGRLRILIKF